MNTAENRAHKYHMMILRRFLLIFALLALAILLIFANGSTMNELLLDEEDPEIYLLGKTTMTILVGEEFEEPGFYATDNGTDFTNRVEISNNVDSSQPGTYSVEYVAVDDNDNRAVKRRTIIVEENYNFQTKDPDFYLRSLENYIEEKEWQVSIGFYNLDNHYTYLYNKDKEYYGASLIKSVAALYAYENLNLSANEKTLVKQMISVSDNEAYIEMADIIGVKKLKEYGENLGLVNFMTDKNNIYYSDTTVENQLKIWQRLWQFINTDEKGEELEAYFLNDKTNYLKFDDSILVMHKYGTWDEYFHDTGIILDDHPYIAVILTEEGNGNYKKIIQDLSEKLYGFNMIV